MWLFRFFTKRSGIAWISITFAVDSSVPAVLAEETNYVEQRISVLAHMNWGKARMEVVSPVPLLEPIVNVVFLQAWSDSSLSRSVLRE